jgi:NADH-quinone oxidoreductase subunit C
MSAALHLQSLRARFAGMVADQVVGILDISAEAAQLRELMLFLRDELGFDFLVFMTAVDWPAENRLMAIYRLFAYGANEAAVVRVALQRDSARVDTLSDIYRTAEWHEREAAEMFGISFTGHPDPRKLLLPDEIEGHPLRKDFSHPDMHPLPEVADVK